MRDVGTQYSMAYATISTLTSFLSSVSPDITTGDLAQSDDTVRFYTGLVNFQMYFAMFRTLLSHGADCLNYWRGELSVGERSYHKKGQKLNPRELWGGHASDRHITMSSGLIPLLEPGMGVMADKGLTIEYLLPENINLNMPPKIPKARQMTEDEVFNM
ncbi:hypothetical protein LSH36_532g03049 [Paralvinella palmiformis]|uniref:Uncharacterized protein n=1 Tax=Paralvinella palmiformis TaxID=53620 RepID=A0AAD9J7V1_9ANNE|nr:hypothetical protein LSH36_532g03049 [Paralvinella palmiformis]